MAAAAADMPRRVRIRPYRDGDRDAVAALILAIQQDEFGMAITLDDQPDLIGIPAFYQRAAGNFWVAEDEADGRIVGTIALLDIGQSDGALRKMFVDRDSRGPELRVAARLLDALRDWAAAHRFERIWLGTTASFHAAHKFYSRNGFEEIGREELPESFPVMAVDTRFFVLRV